MLKVKVTENYTGFTISGDYEDLNSLYDAFSYFISYDPKNKGEYLLQNHIYGFLYDLRHAYQGDREVCLSNNNLYEENRKWHQLKKSEITCNNLYYSFNYIVTDLIEDIVIFQYFKKKKLLSEKMDYNVNLLKVEYFHSLVFEALNEMVLDRKLNMLKSGILNSYISDKYYYPQWYELITLKYLESTKKNRIRNFSNIMNSIYDFLSDDDYDPFVKDLLKECKEKNCNIQDLEYNFPEEIKW